MSEGFGFILSLGGVFLVVFFSPTNKTPQLIQQYLVNLNVWNLESSKVIFASKESKVQWGKSIVKLKGNN